MSPAFDPASRKTVSCSILEAAFAKDPHPDGKVMSALAQKLNLNKKQVSNFFERERRKANIVIESRRKGTPVASADNASVTSSSSKKSSSAAVPSASKPGAPLARQGSAKLATGAGAAASTKASSVTSSKLSREPSQQSVPKQASQVSAATLALDTNQDDEDAEDADGEPDLDYTEDSTIYTSSTSRIEPEEEVPIIQLAENPLVSKNKEILQLRSEYKGGTQSSRYASRNARYASRNPLYATATVIAYGDNRPASYLPQAGGARHNHSHRDASSTPSLTSRSSSPAQTRHAVPHANLLAPAFVATKSASQSSKISKASSQLDNTSSPNNETAPKPKRKRGDRLQESPTVLFLRNPFPAPLPATNILSQMETGGDSDVVSLQEAVREISIAQQSEHIVPVALDEMYQQPYHGRKRARVWFARKSPEVDQKDASKQDKSTSAADMKESPSRPSRSADSEISSQPIVLPETRSTRTAATRTRAEGSSRAARGQDGPDYDEGDSDDSDDAFASDSGLRRKKDSRPGAALRNTIACNELKQSFQSNPHPPSTVLEALANRLGLGKKQVSNYFVRERKKAGYTIKVRHGLQGRRGPNKKPRAKPAVVVTQHDDASGVFASQSTVQPDDMLMDEEQDDDDLIEQEEVETDEDEPPTESILGSHASDARFEAFLQSQIAGNRSGDDVPDLSYEDVDIRVDRYGTIQNEALAPYASSLMVPSKSMDSMTTSSRQDEDEELASPPFQDMQLPPTPDFKGGMRSADGFIAYHDQALPNTSHLTWI